MADGQDETGAATTVRGRAVELLEDPVLLALRQPRAMVGDLHGDLAIGRGRDDPDRAIGGGGPWPRVPQAPPQPTRLAILRGRRREAQPGGRSGRTRAPSRSRRTPPGPPPPLPLT